MPKLFRELKRRNVYKVGVAYLVAAFVAVQLADLAAGAFSLPGWFEPMVWVLCGLGFPPALVIAWAFELTPDGVRRTPPPDEPGSERASAREPSSDPEPGWSATRTATTGLVALGVLLAVAVGAWHLLGSGSEPEITDRSIAVLPFENMGGEESAQFTRGVHDGLLTRLSNVSDLRVISRTSVTKYRDTRLDLPAIADSLGVQWVVEGAVQQAGDQVQVNAQLIRAEDDAHRWARTYRRDLTPENVFAIQSELTKRIARSLQAQVSPEEAARVEQRPTRDLEAYQLYVQGRQRFARWSGACIECIRDAAEHFRGALERDSTFAMAWAGLADVAALVQDLRGSATVPDTLLPDPNVLPDPRWAAQRALELDPDLAEAHASMGHIHFREQNAPAALVQLRRAVALKPSYWEAHRWLADLYWFLGRRQESLEHAQLAVELNPQHAQARHGLYDAYTATGNPEKGLEEARLQQELGLEQVSAVGGEVRALRRLGRLEEARRIAEEQITERGPDTFWGSWFRAYLTGILAEQGDTAQAERYLDQLRAADADSGRLTHQLAMAYGSLGRFDQVLRTLQRGDPSQWGGRGASLGALLRWREEQPQLANDPRFRALVREVSLAWNLNPDGSLPDSVDVGTTSAE